jgi:biopolymer transport protein ExbB
MMDWQWLQQGDGVTQATAGLLLLLSVLSWVVIVYKSLLLVRSHQQVMRAVSVFWQASDMSMAQMQLAALDRRTLLRPMVAAVVEAKRVPHAASVAQASATPAPLSAQAALSARLTRGLRSALTAASVQLHWGQVLLASIGAIAPFVGLLGTVWGIHHALSGLSNAAQISIAQLAGPVGEALVMTAAGLAVAIPAVLAYNLLGRLAARVEAELEGFAHDLQAYFGESSVQGVQDSAAAA